MPINDGSIQKRTPEIARFRTGGEQQGNRPGEQLETYRVTSSSEAVVKMFAERFGGDPKPFNNRGKSQFQVIVTEREIPIVLPPDKEQAYSRDYEKWGGAQLAYRCDGNYCTARDDDGNPVVIECQCPLGSRNTRGFCSVTTRVRFIVPDIAIEGISMLSTNSVSAAAEIPGVIDYGHSYYAGQPLTGLLGIERRTSKRDDQSRRYSVAVLRLVGNSADNKPQLTAPDEQEALEPPDDGYEPGTGPQIDSPPPAGGPGTLATPGPMEEFFQKVTLATTMEGITDLLGQIPFERGTTEYSQCAQACTKRVQTLSSG